MTYDLSNVTPDPRPEPSAGGIGRPKAHPALKLNPRLAAVEKQIRDALLERAGGECEIGLVGCLRQAIHVHHRKLRSQGGTDELTNLLHVCNPCHGRVHASPEKSYRHGWLVRSTDDPAAVELLPVHEASA